MIISNSAGAKIIDPQARITAIEPSLRLQQTATTFAKTAGFTMLSAFIPILHFILVPVGVVLTATLTYSAFRKNYVAKNLEILCPSCDKKFVQSIYGQQMPLRTYCLQCRQTVYLENEHTTQGNT